MGRRIEGEQYEVEKALYGEHAAKIRFMMRLNE